MLLLLLLWFVAGGQARVPVPVLCRHQHPPEAAPRAWATPLPVPCQCPSLPIFHCLSLVGIPTCLARRPATAALFTRFLSHQEAHPACPCVVLTLSPFPQLALPVLLPLDSSNRL